MTRLEAAGVEFFAGNGSGPGVRLAHDPDSFDQFMAFLKLYERNRLLALGRHANPLPLFGYRFEYAADGADLTFRGARLGQVRWQEGRVTFTPPLASDSESALSDKAFDEWVARAEYRSSTGG
ncbi:hypothetical protein [Sphingobium sp. EM0848]|uniref:hypothetical protein n=1 Tax=Sphingobium sp. EM0848 TaxID=2743473 RepID=UPI001C3F7EDE|nr:hypothetical protein [Sphingobium sp. EM0848]